MKLTFLLFLLFFAESLVAQNDSFNLYLSMGKEMFKGADSTRTESVLSLFEKAAENFEKAVHFNQNSQEAHYFLGYTYARLNSRQELGLAGLKTHLTLKASKEFETVLAISPGYNGEIVILDPYSKITSEWGSLAHKFTVANQIDSARWAFNEGKKRGGFRDYMVTTTREILRSCTDSAILISSGDNPTFHLWYVQMIEGFRKDVKVIDNGLLASDWYPSYLVRNKIVSFDITGRDLDSVQYIPWFDQDISIPFAKGTGSFDWKVPPSYNSGYLMRNDLIMLSLLRKNQFRFNVYMTEGFNLTSMLGLDKHFQNHVLVNRINYNKASEPDFKSYYKVVERFLGAYKFANQYSPDEQIYRHTLQRNMLIKVNELLDNKQSANAKGLWKLYSNYFITGKFKNPDFEQYEAYIKGRFTI